jgi:hypothetical protein
MPTYRQMAAVGVVANIHLRLGEREKQSLELGRAMAVERMKADPRRQSPLDRLDLWLLDHFNSFHLDDELDAVLPSISVRRRRAELVPLLAAVQPGELTAAAPNPSPRVRE